MDRLIKNLAFLNERLPKQFKKKEALKNLTEVVSSLNEITNQDDFETCNDVIDSVTSSLRYASYDVTGEVYKPVSSNITKVVKSFLEVRGYTCSKFTGYSFNATKNNKVLAFNSQSFRTGAFLYAETLKFKKIATILPDGKFVAHLAKKAFETLMRIKPKDVSKCLAGLIHTTFFDYALDKNIFLTSNFYHELRNKYLKSLKANLGVTELKYYATNSKDKELASLITENVDNPKKHSSFYGKAKNIYAKLSDTNLCDRILVIAELLGMSDNKVMPLAASLSSITNLEFKFIDE